MIGSHAPTMTPATAAVGVALISGAAVPNTIRPSPLATYTSDNDVHRCCPWAIPASAPISVSGTTAAPHSTTGQGESSRRASAMSGLSTAQHAAHDRSHAERCGRGGGGDAVGGVRRDRDPARRGRLHRERADVGHQDHAEERSQGAERDGMSGRAATRVKA